MVHLVSNKENSRYETTKLVGLELVNLLDVNGQATCGIQAPRTHVALEMLRLLMLHENLEQMVSHSDMVCCDTVAHPFHLRTRVHSTNTRAG